MHGIRLLLVFEKQSNQTIKQCPMLSISPSLPPGQVDLFTMRGPLWSSTSVEFSLELEAARAPPGVPPAQRDFFLLKRTSFNQAVITLLRPIMGPQEVRKLSSSYG